MLEYSPGVFALVPADPVLVHTGVGAAIRDLLSRPGAFNHVVVRVRHEGTELWINPIDVSRSGDVAGWKYLPFHHGLKETPNRYPV